MKGAVCRGDVWRNYRHCFGQRNNDRSRWVARSRFVIGDIHNKLLRPGGTVTSVEHSFIRPIPSPYRFLWIHRIKSIQWKLPAVMRVSVFSRFLLHPTCVVAFSASPRIVTVSAVTRLKKNTFLSVASRSDEQKQQESSKASLLLGGDYAGYAASCDTVSGAAQPVPVYLVPSSLLEWGQHPKALEVIVSEDYDDLSHTTTDDDTTEQPWMMNRVCLTVLPAIGCGVDNLEVQKTTQEGWKVLSSNTDNNCIGLVREDSTTSLMIETIFGVASEQQEEPNRLRVTVTAAAGKEESPFKDIVVSYERRFEAESTQGTRANGGGLDGASVSRWMGPLIAKQGVKTLETPPKATAKGNPAILDLPAGVTLEYGTESESIFLRVSHSGGQSIQYKWKSDDLTSIQVISS